jgi:hypothetical protein
MLFVRAVSIGDMIGNVVEGPETALMQDLRLQTGIRAVRSGGFTGGKK